MATAKCAVCGKTAYPLESLTAIEKTYHKICFKCDVCGGSLNLKNYKGVAGKVYCFTHTPVDRASTGSDSVTAKVAANAPKKASEGLGTAQKGTGEVPNVGLDTVASQTALKAPKVVAESIGNIQKGTGEVPNVGLDTVASQTALKAPKVVAESLGNVQKGTGDTPNMGLDTVANKSALNAPKAKAESLGTVHKGDGITAPKPASESGEAGEPEAEAPPSEDS